MKNLFVFMVFFATVTMANAQISSSTTTTTTTSGVSQPLGVGYSSSLGAATDPCVGLEVPLGVHLGAGGYSTGLGLVLGNYGLGLGVPAYGYRGLGLGIPVYHHAGLGLALGTYGRTFGVPVGVGYGARVGVGIAPRVIIPPVVAPRAIRFNRFGGVRRIRF